MALFRKFFFRKPPDGVLLITDNIYVFDHCFSLNAPEEDQFEAHTRGIAAHLLEDFHDHSFMVANFGTRTEESRLYHILSGRAETGSYGRHRRRVGRRRGSRGEDVEFGGRESEHKRIRFHCAGSC